MGEPHLHAHQTSVSFNESKGGSSTWRSEYRTHPGTGAGGDPPGASPSFGWPQLLAQPDFRPERTQVRPGTAEHWLRAGEGAGPGSIPSSPRAHPLLAGPCRHPKAARTHRLAPSPPPTPQHLSPGMLWEAQAGQCRRATAVAGLKGKCFLNEIKRGLFSRALVVP